MTRPPHAASSVVGYASDTASAVGKVEPNSNRSRETGRPYCMSSRFQLYPVDGRLRMRRLPGECFQQSARLIGYKLMVVPYTSGELFTVMPNRLLCSRIDTSPVSSTEAFCETLLVPFASQHFGDDYRYQDDNTTPHRARAVFYFLQQSNVTKMEQPARTPDCNPIENIWDELGCAITSMDNPSQNLDDLRQALLDKWAEIPVERLNLLVASMPLHLVTIIPVRGWSTRCWPGIHKTTSTGGFMQKVKIVWSDLPQSPSSDI